MTPSRIMQFDKLVDDFEDGLVSEVQFLKTGLEIGASLTALNEVLESVRLEDGIRRKTMLDADLKARWIAALRSGEFKQTTLDFQNGKGFCCLGVLCKVAGQPTTGGESGNWTFVDGVLPGGYPTSSKLAEMNDRGKSFLHIADYIEEHL